MLRYKIITIILIVIILLSVTVILLVGMVSTDDELFIEWQNNYGGVENDLFISIAASADGGYVLAGGTESEGAGDEDGWVVKVDAWGNEQWNKTFGDQHRDEFESVAACPDGGYILAGQFYSVKIKNQAGWVVKLDSEGNVQWNRLFGGPNVDFFDSVAVCPDGGYILAGATEVGGDRGFDGWVLKLDSEGYEEWNRTLGDTIYDYFNCVIPSLDGGYILGGEKYSSGYRYYGGWVVSLDSEGNELWNRMYSGRYDDWIYSLAQVPGEGYLFAGWSSSRGSGGYNGWVMQIDSSGEEQWNRSFGKTLEDMIWYVTPDPNGGYVLAGWMNNPDWDGACEGWILKIDEDGNELWSGLLGGWLDDGFYSATVGQDGGYTMAGWSETDSAGGFDGWVVKVTTSRVEALQPSTVIFIFGIIVPITLIVAIQVWLFMQKKPEKS